MTKEYNSRLGRRVAERASRGPSRKLCVLATAVATCAMVFATAAYALAMKGESNAPMTEYVIFNGYRDDLVNVETDDEGNIVSEELLATRVMNLKVKGDHLSAGDGCPMVTAKFNYVINVVVASDNFDREGLELGKLVLPAVANDELTAVTVKDGTFAASAKVYDAADKPLDNTTESVVSANEVTVYVPVLTDTVDESGETVDVAYAAGYSISVIVTFQVEVDLELLEGLDVSEIPWADETTVNEEVIGPDE